MAALEKDKTPTGFDLEGLCESSVTEFEKQAYSPSEQLKERSYKSHVINNALENARHVNRSNLLRTSTKRGTNSANLLLSPHMSEHKIYPMARRFKKGTNSNDSWLRTEGWEFVKASVRGVDRLHRLLQREACWIFKLDAVVCSRD